MNKPVFAIFISLLATINLYAKDICVKVIDNENKEAIPYASLSVQYSDTTTYHIADMEGRCCFSPLKYPLQITASALGMTDNTIVVSESPLQELQITLSFKTQDLKEVVVKGTARLTKMGEKGLTYDMAKNQRAQKENSLQALAYVPLIKVDGDGKISLQGSSDFSIFINGRPSEMVQTSPQAYLESIPASNIQKVEIITNPTAQYGPDVNTRIINIVLKDPIVDGYRGVVKAGGTTQPTANADLSGMIKKGNVEASLAYNYTLDGQRHQPSSVNYTSSTSGDQWGSHMKGTGNWNTHTMRAMLKWQVDQQNSLYLDAHGLVKYNKFHTAREITYPSSYESLNPANVKNSSDYTSGAVEANAIYRHYASKQSNSERFTFGYHYTYNPDKRNVTQTDETGKQTGYDNVQRTNGGMSEHTVMTSWLLPLSAKHYLRTTLKDIYRTGHTHSSWEYADGADAYTEQMKYTDQIFHGSIAYTGNIGKVRIQSDLDFDYDYIDMKLDDASLNYKRHRTYWMPTERIIWSPNQSSQFSLKYRPSIVRPSIVMLNPFRSTQDGYGYNEGNPELEPQHTHNVSMMYYTVLNGKVVLAFIGNYYHMTDIILQYFNQEGDYVNVRGYGNIGKADKGELISNIQWSMLPWLNFTLYSSVGVRWMSGHELNLYQRDFECNITPIMDFLLPDNYRLTCQVGYYHPEAAPWTTKRGFVLYSINARKSFLKGRLNVSAIINSPFSRYIHIKETSRMATLKRVQLNSITARSFGLNISYAFNSGKKINLRRDDSLSSEDLTTGVK
jgi:hypothetical protein